MATKPIDVTDETGQAWLVFEDTAAWAPVRALYNHGVREIILPRHTIITGGVLDIALTDMLHWDVENAVVARVLRRNVRLQDCIKWLKEHNQCG